MNTEDYLVPQWPVPAHVRALCTTRAGGRSKPPYDSLNLGDHVGDSADDVAHNRRQLAQALQARPVFLSQVHGARVEVLGAASRDGVQADACLAAEAGLACTIMVADCLPVLFSNRSGSVVAAAHAGWRGLAGTDGVGVLESTVAALRAAQAASGDRTESEWLAWLGPCIGPQAFEVGAEVRQAFVAQDGRAQNLFRPHAQGKWLADLPGLARLRLAQLGVNQVFGNDGSQAWCTFSQSSRFFSHRRDRVSGRLAACIWLV